MGLRWDEPIDFFFTTGYQLLMDEHVKRMFEEQKQSETEEVLKEGIKMKTIAQMNNSI